MGHRVALGLIPSFAILVSSAKGWPLSTAPVMAAWWVLEVIVLAQPVLSSQTAAPPVLLLLPFSTTDTERYTRDRAIGLLWRPTFDAVSMLAALALLAGAGPAGWSLVPPLGLLCGLSVWSAALWFKRWFAPSPAVMLAVVVFPVAVGILSDSAAVHEQIRAVVIGNAAALTLLSPGGWVAAGYLALLGSAPEGWLAGLLASAALGASSVWALRTFVRRTPSRIHLLAHWLDAAAEERRGEEDEEEDEPELPPRPPRVRSPIEVLWGSTALSVTRAGWIEQRLLKWLTPRETLVLECAVTRIPPWTRWMVRSLQCFVAAAIAGTLAVTAPSMAILLLWPAGLLTLLALVLGLPVASGFDQMVGQLTLPGLTIARPALYPIDLKEFVTLTRKAAAIRGVLILPVLCLAGWTLGTLAGTPTAEFALGGAKLAAISIGVSPWLCILAISGASDDSRRFSLRGVGISLLVIAFSVTMLGLSIAALVVPILPAAALVAVLSGLAWSGSRIYARVYNRGGFDLVQSAGSGIR